MKCYGLYLVEQSFHALAGASHFSLLVQRKVTKRKHAPSSRPARLRRCGFASPAEISVRDIPVPYKNLAHPCAPPCGLSLPALPLRYGAPTCKLQKQQQHDIESSKAAKQQSSKAAKQQSSKAAKQQSSKAAKQQSSKAAGWDALTETG
ncbi:hypothetical protein XFF4834R_chr41690 [Xanthomonas citri pv. fuscans]|nr:hypothetical protein XFF4834R_chr41690 [Xanthomonas citri pv. fuscans]